MDTAFDEMIGGWISPAAALQISEDAIAAFLMQRLKVLAETGLVIDLCLDHLDLDRPLTRPGTLGYRCQNAERKPLIPTSSL